MPVSQVLFGIFSCGDHLAHPAQFLPSRDPLVVMMQAVHNGQANDLAVRVFGQANAT